MATCSFSSINGINKDCEQFLSAMQSMAITAPSFSFASIAASKNLETWRTAIQEQGTYDDVPLSVMRKIRSVEITEPEAVEETDGFGVKFVDVFNAPSMNIMLSSNPCDYQELVSLGAKIVRIIPLNEDGSKMYHLTDTGTLKGFEAQIVARPFSPKSRENKITQYPLMVNFTQIDEFKNVKVINDGLDTYDYLEDMPVGYTQEITSALSTANMYVKIYKRCSETTLGTDTFTAEILETNLTTTDYSVSVGAISTGISVLTIYRAGTTELANGEYIKFRLVKKNGDIYEQITNALIARATS